MQKDPHCNIPVLSLESIKIVERDDLSSLLSKTNLRIVFQPRARSILNRAVGELQGHPEAAELP